MPSFIRDKKVVFNILNPVDLERKRFADSMVNFSGWVKQQLDLSRYGHVPMYLSQAVVEAIDAKPISEEEQLYQWLE